jgi:alpha/beta superfamily hydrolase
VARNETFELAGPAGRLEAILMHPDAGPVAAAVVCHAHPLQGGIMHFKVVFRAAKALQRQGLAALRFNFRGVGTSEGTHDKGRGEQDDVRAALDEMERRFAGLPLILGGFSFGSSMALRVGAADPRPRAIFALGFPAGMMTDTSFLENLHVPRLFVQGEKDTIGPPDALRALLTRSPEPRRLVVIDGADHFFTDRLDALEETIASWAAERPWDPKAP